MPDLLSQANRAEFWIRYTAVDYTATSWLYSILHLQISFAANGGHQPSGSELTDLNDDCLAW